MIHLMDFDQINKLKHALENTPEGIDLQGVARSCNLNQLGLDIKTGEWDNYYMVNQEGSEYKVVERSIIQDLNKKIFKSDSITKFFKFIWEQIIIIGSCGSSDYTEFYSYIKKEKSLGLGLGGYELLRKYYYEVNGLYYPSVDIFKKNKWKELIDTLGIRIRFKNANGLIQLQNLKWDIPNCFIISLWPKKGKYGSIFKEIINDEAHPELEFNVSTETKIETYPFEYKWAIFYPAKTEEDIENHIIERFIEFMGDGVTGYSGQISAFMMDIFKSNTKDIESKLASGFLDIIKTSNNSFNISTAIKKDAPLIYNKMKQLDKSIDFDSLSQAGDWGL